MNMNIYEHHCSRMGVATKACLLYVALGNTKVLLADTALCVRELSGNFGFSFCVSCLFDILKNPQ